MFGFRTLRPHQDAPLLAKLDREIQRAGNRGVFNVSLLETPSGLVAAYRGFAPSFPGAPRAFLCSWNASGEASTVDLSAFGDELGLSRVADPKLFVFGGEVFLSFNTGYVAVGENSIYVIRITPQLGTPQLVVADFERQQVEKNWAFSEAPDGTLSGIYQLHPYREVRLLDGRPGTDDRLLFGLRTPRSVTTTMAGSLSLGTQPIAVDDRLLLVAHEKVVVRGKRMYFGRPVSVTGFGTDEVSVAVSSDRLIHSVAAALPRRGKLNKNLLSATYFSGIDADSEDVLLGYGINDVGHSIVRMERKALWP